MSAPMPWIEKCYWSLPRPLRVAIARGGYRVTAPFRRIRNFVQSFRPSAWRIAGERLGEKVVLLYAGGSQSAHYFAQRMGGRECVPEPLGAPLPRCGDADIEIVEVDRLFAGRVRRAGALVVPQWVGFGIALDAPGGYEAPIHGNKSLRSDLRRLRRDELRRGATQDPALFEVFYEEMYRPHLSARHGEAARRSSRWWMRRLMEQGTLLQVLRRGEFVGGDIVIRRGREAVAMIMALRLDREGEFSPGLTAALYHFAIEWAQEQACREIDFGHCRPILNDGLVRYKRKWEMRVHDDPLRVDRVLAVKVRRFTPAVLRFLVENPMFVLEPEGLTGWVFDDSREPVARDRLRELLHGVLTVGLERFCVASPAGLAPDAAEAVSSELGVSVRAAVLDDRWPPAVSAA